MRSAGSDRVDRDAADAAGLVDGSQLLDADAVIRRFDHHPDVAVAALRGDDENSAPGAPSTSPLVPVTRSAPPASAAATRPPAVDGTSRRGTVSQPAQKGRCRLGILRQHGTGEHRRQERAGKQRPPGFLEDDGHRDPVGIVAAVLFRQMQGQQARVEQRLPVPGQLAGDEPFEPWRVSSRGA